MSGISKTIKDFKNLKYFNTNLVIDKEKVDTISEKDVKNQKRFAKELDLVQSYLTIHYYKNLNDRTLISPEQFRFNISNCKEPFCNIEVLGRKFPFLSDAGFNYYSLIYDKINGK